MKALCIGRFAPPWIVLLGSLVAAGSVHADAPRLMATPSSVTFNLQDTGTLSAPVVVTVSSSGEGAVKLTAVELTGAFQRGTGDSCQPGSSVGGRAGSCTVNVIFAPTRDGEQSGTLTLSSRNATVVVSLKGTARTPKPVANLAGSGDFGSVGLLYPKVLKLNLNNSGPGSLQGVTVSVSGDASFRRIGGSCGNSLPVGACTVEVSFTPMNTGAASGRLSVQSSNGTPISPISLTGTGVAPTVSASPSPVAFQDTFIGSTSTQSVSIKNNGPENGKWPVSGVSVSSESDFQVQSQTCTGHTLDSGSSCDVTVAFTPTRTGARSGALTVNSSSLPRSVTVALSGSGKARQGVLAVDPTTLTFSKNCRREESSTPAQPVVVSTTGDGPLSGLTVGPLPVSGFQVNNGCSSTLAAGAKCAVSVRFTGRVTAQGSFNVSALGSGPIGVNLTGTCTNQASP